MSCLLHVLLVTLIPLQTGQSIPKPDARNPDEAIVEAVALSLLPDPKGGGQSRPDFLAIWPDWSPLERGDFERAVDSFLKSEWLGDLERSNLDRLKSSLTDDVLEVAPPVPISKMTLDPRLIVTRTDFRRQSRMVRNRSGKEGYVLGHYGFSLPSYSQDGKHALIGPGETASTSTAFGSAVVTTYFMKKTEKGWAVDFKVTYLSN